MGVKSCKVAGCNRKHWAKGYCNTHRSRLRRGADLSQPIRVQDPDRPCKYPQCIRPYYAAGCCGHHYHIHKNRISHLRKGSKYSYNARRDPIRRLGLVFRKLKMRTKGIGANGGNISVLAARDNARYKGLPLGTKDWLIEYSLKQSPYLDIFEGYRRSGFERVAAPTLIMLNQDKGYVPGNVRWTTLSIALSEARVRNPRYVNTGVTNAISKI